MTLQSKGQEIFSSPCLLLGLPGALWPHKLGFVRSQDGYRNTPSFPGKARPLLRMFTFCFNISCKTLLVNAVCFCICGVFFLQLVVRGGNRRLLQDIDCGGLCTQRCSLHSRPNLCNRACGTCCVRCKCVPPGTSGNRELLSNQMIMYPRDAADSSCILASVLV
ncbi:hypothetical protein D5086_023376 [Populus alba]|uniref:Uncharacterized protein n=1 Tax=Populus alba TaxID=43335 RepID=A0ACC4BAB2_POPAL